jgi:hypothetical protein
MIFGLGAAMGWSASEVKAASLWEFFSAWQGYVDANTPKQPGKLTEDEKDRIWERMQEMDRPGSIALSTETYRLDGAHLVPAGIVTFEV